VARAEPAPAPATSSASGDYVVQTAAFRSEEEARDEYRKLRDKHGGLIASYGPLIQKADLGSRGVYYRLRLGPIDSKGAASSLCDSLLAAGEKDCLVRRQ
jgi:cell division septation protein DedD